MPTSQTRLLFEDTDTEVDSVALRALFAAWVAHRAQAKSTIHGERALRDASITVYQDMWYSFDEFCAARRLDFSSLAPHHLKTYLITRGTGSAEQARLTIKSDQLTPRYAWRMLTLVDRLARFSAERAGTAPNLAARTLLDTNEFRFANARDNDSLPDCLSEVDARRLIAYLTQDGRVTSTASLSWKTVRDRTAVALMLGAGLSPGDVRALTLPGVITHGGKSAMLPWKLALPGNGNSPARETPIASWAGQQLAFWLGVRTQQHIAGAFVFPSTATGTAWSHTACHIACKAVLADAGMTDDGGAFKLRHTFALRQLAKGKSEKEVAQWLGLLDLRGMYRYRRIVVRPVDVN